RVPAGREVRLARGQRENAAAVGRAEQARHLLGDGEAARRGRRAGCTDPDRNRPYEPAVSEYVELSPVERGAQLPLDGLDGDVAPELDPAVAAVRQRFGRHLDPAAPNADDADDERPAERTARPDTNESRPIGPGAEDDAAVQRAGGEGRCRAVRRRGGVRRGHDRGGEICNQRVAHLPAILPSAASAGTAGGSLSASGQPVLEKGELSCV